MLRFGDGKVLLDWGEANGFEGARLGEVKVATDGDLKGFEGVGGDTPPTGFLSKSRRFEIPSP